MRVAVLRCRQLPAFVTWDVPDVESLFTDDALLLAELARRDVAAEPVVWSEPDVEWGAFDVALIRSTWDYIDDLEHFLSVLARIERSSCLLVNPLSAVRWNTDKTYLFDLAEWEVPIVPTFPAAADPRVLRHALARDGWDHAVLKPRVGAGAAGVRRMPLDELAPTLAALAGGARSELLVQPLVESVVAEGEWSYVYVAGELSHVLLKTPAPGDYRAHGIYGGTITPVDPPPDDRAQVDAMLARLPFDLLYARLDLVRIGNRLVVMELELIEPMLYLALAPAAAGRLASATIARLGQGRGTPL